MRLMRAYAAILNVSHAIPVKAIDYYGRTCYKSEQSDNPQQWSKFVRKRVDDGHLSIIEHCTATVKIVCDRGVSHELVRHRLVSFSQESTRYCNYGSSHLMFIIPCWTSIEEGETSNDIQDDGSYRGILFYNDQELKWLAAMAFAENFYKELLADNWTPQQARSVLPNSLKTELIMTANLREWRTIFSLRCDKTAHPQMREIMLPLLKEFYNSMPDFFEDLYSKFLGGNSERKESSGLD